jgi:isopentenyldiphosphate isomerase
MQDELFATFDADGNAGELVPRSRVHREGLWHRAANVFLFRSDGRLIVQRRQRTKDVCPNAWDLTMAEHLQPGETYSQAAVRGLREELGIEHVALEALGGVQSVRLEIPEQGVKDYELQQSFWAIFDGELRPDPGEVAEVAAVHLDDLRGELAARPQDFTPWLRASVAKLELRDG